MCSSKTDQCPGRDIEHGLTVRPLACLTAGSCRRRPAKNALSKQQPRRKPRVGRFRTPGRNGSKVHSAGLNCLDLHLFFCIGVVCSAIQEILIVLICRSYPIAFGLRVQRILPKLLQKKSTAPRLATEPAEGWNAPAMFQRLNFEDSWAEAELMESCIYLRGSVHLKVPARWKRAFPTHV